MKTPLINFDPVIKSDLWSSEWEYALECGYFTLKDVVELFKKKLITASEYIYAVDYLGDKKCLRSKNE